MSKLAKALTAAAGNAAGESLYVEDVFSTYLYDGNSSTQTITNGIDLDGEGGLVWLKSRSNSSAHALFDTERGASNFLISNSTNADDSPGDLNGFNSDGFDLTLVNGHGNFTGRTYASWTFRKAEKFFDVVTYTGTGSVQTIAHNLGSVPACIIIKTTSQTSNWPVYHVSLANTETLFLNSTDAKASVAAGYWNSTTPTDSVFSLGTANAVNQSGQDFVAYLFASDAGGFGDDGTENIIKCGSYTADASNNYHVDVGFEPQWVMIKRTDSTGDWEMLDVMRGFTADASAGQFLEANNSNAEFNDFGAYLTSTGFVGSNQSGANGASYIYIAIRRPMKTPESGTEVFKANYVDNGASFPDMLSDFPVDMYFRRYVNTTNNPYWLTRLLGRNVLDSSSTGAEQTFSENSTAMDSNVGVMNIFSANNTDFYGWMFKRATGFFDVVAYTGDGASSQAINHNLGASPELIIVKRRELSGDWICQVPYTASPQDYMIKLHTDEAAVNFDDAWRDTAPTATNFTVGSWSYVNTNGGAYISYLFATLAGVSKVGSYTGTGSNVDVDCGFSAGARFILIKRTDSTGDWYVWDSERGIVAGNDPYLLLNSTAAEVTSTDYIDPLNAGFTVTSSAPAALNASGGTYIFLAIA